MEELWIDDFIRYQFKKLGNANIDFAAFTRSDFINLKQIYDWMFSCTEGELSQQDDLMKTAAESVLRVLEIKFDLNEEAQGQKNILTRAMHKIESYRLRQEYIEKSAIHKQIIQNYLKAQSI